MDPNLIHKLEPEFPPEKTDIKKILAAAGAVVAVILAFAVYYFILPKESGEKQSGGLLIPASELSLAGTIAEKKSDSISIVSPNPTAPDEKPELYVVKILPETDFLEVDKSRPDVPERKISFEDLKVSQKVFVRYIQDKPGNLNAQKIYLIIGPSVAASNTEKLKK